MPLPILATKLYIPPPQPGVVGRPQLIRRLNEGLKRGTGVALLSAAAGFGKTTLVSEWVAACQREMAGLRVAWLSLDEGDNDPARFLAYLAATLHAAAPSLGGAALADLDSPQPAVWDIILIGLLNEMAEFQGRLIVTLDDYHVINANTVDEAVTYLIEHLPPQVFLVITTREDPDLPLARLRARGQLTELRATDLRFSRAEAGAFLTGPMGLHLSAADIEALEARTEGWIAGLHLAAISMQGRREVAGFIASFTGSHHFVMDYLVEEVLHGQPQPVQDFLMRTSILNRLCGPLCSALMQADPDSGQQALEHLQRANLLVVPLDDERKWFRYHHLFADVLQARLLKQAPQLAPSLHLAACAWFEQNGFRADAIHHALAAADFGQAAELIEREWRAKSGTYFRSATWLGWVKALPEGMVRSRAGLSLGYAWELLFLGDLEAAHARIADAGRLLEGASDPAEAEQGMAQSVKTRPLQASLALARAFHAQALGDAAATERHARRALALASDTGHQGLGYAKSLLGLARLALGDLETAFSLMADAMAELRAAGNLLFATSGTFVLANIRATQGRLGDAIAVYEQALRSVADRGEPLLQGTADLHLGLSELYRERGNLPAALEHLSTAEALGKQAALDEWPYGLYLAQARFKEDEGDLQAALALIDRAASVRFPSPVPDARPVTAIKARLWIRQGSLSDALGWARQTSLTVDDELNYLQEFEHLTLARLLMAQHESNAAGGFARQALALLERLLQAAEAGGRIGSAIEILILQALALQAQGDQQAAQAPLKRALRLAEPEGYVQLFANEGRAMTTLLTAAAASTRVGEMADTQARYVRRLLGAFQTRVETQPLPPGQPGLVEALSPRELEVLKLIAQGLSNNEICERLVLALSTVKGHNLRIFSKLQVQRRTEAVARARELGLV